MHVLAGTDGSALSISAAQRGMALLGTPDQVTVLAVLTEIPGDDAGGFEGSVLSSEQQDEQWRTEVDHALAQLARTAASLSGAAVDQRIEIGDIAPVICRVAAELHVDAIVVGSHARGAIGRFSTAR